MNNIPNGVSFTENDTEQSFTIQTETGHIDLSILASAGECDPACVCRAEYNNGNPLSEEKLHIPENEKELLIQLLHKSKFI